jgi:hypothetical protein
MGSRRRRCCLLVLDGLVEDGGGHSQVLDGGPADVARGDLEEPIAGGARVDHVRQVQIHPRVTAPEPSVVRFPALELHQDRGRNRRPEQREG